MNKIQKAVYEMLKDVDNLCNKYQIKYFLAFGTLLGAVRHNGFIPWDDDIDIMMDIDNINKFINAMAIDFDFSNKYFFQSYKTDNKTQYSWYKIRKNNSCMILEGDYPYDMHLGIYIDLFPLCDSRKSKIGKKFQLLCSKTLYILMINNKKCRKIIQLIKKIIFLFGKKNIINLFYHLTFYSNKKSNEYFLVGLFTSNAFYSKKAFSSQKKVEFVNSKFPIPIGYDYILKKVYNNYMIEVKYPSHNPVYFDVNKSYEEYIKLLKK